MQEELQTEGAAPESLGSPESTESLEPTETPVGEPLGEDEV